MGTSDVNDLKEVQNFGILLCKHAVRNIKSHLHVKPNLLVHETGRQIYKNMNLST